MLVAGHDWAHGEAKQKVDKEESGMFFRVPFEKVPDLVRKRMTLLEQGEAIVYVEDVANLATTEFKKRLWEAMNRTSRRWEAFAKEEEQRLQPIVQAMSERYAGEDQAAKSRGGMGERITAEDLPGLAKQSFPLCMRTLLERVQTDGHLRHQGRMQLGLFLKGIGLPLQESLKFWRREFTQRGGITNERFDKEYAYNIRHNYGQEGSRTDYTPYSCQKIIHSKPGQGEFHGCPFATLSEQQLRQRLSSLSLTESHVNEIVKQTRDRHYQIACTRALEYSHYGYADALNRGIEHPNQYFKESRRFILGLHSEHDENSKPPTNANANADAPTTPPPPK